VLLAVRDVAQGLVAMHQAGFIHRDVKMENVLLNSNGRFKLCDFGSITKNKIFKFKDNGERVDATEDIEANTTPMYRAPELVDTYLKYFTK
jgi:serine/threonine protein kinase